MFTNTTLKGCCFLLTALLSSPLRYNVMLALVFASIGMFFGYVLHVFPFWFKMIRRRRDRILVSFILAFLLFAIAVIYAASITRPINEDLAIYALITEKINRFWVLALISGFITYKMSTVSRLAAEEEKEALFQKALEEYEEYYNSEIESSEA